MARRSKFDLVFAPEALDHLGAIEPKIHGLIRAAVETQLSHAADVQTRNRKPLYQTGPYGATWELRCGRANSIRVMYAFEPTGRTVRIVAIGVKLRNRIFFGGKEFIA